MFTICFPSRSFSKTLKAFDSCKMLLDCTEINYGDFSLFADEGVLSLHYQLYTTDSNPGLPIGFLKHDLFLF